MEQNLLRINENINENEFNEVYAGWVSVLMNLKAVADFQCDLRNHNLKKLGMKAMPIINLKNCLFL